MPLYRIYAGLDGSFGGAEYVDTVECTDQNEAELVAGNAAVDEYESMAGLHGLLTYEEVCEENDIDPDTDPEAAEGVYMEEMESWIEYYVEETDNYLNPDAEDEDDE